MRKMIILESDAGKHPAYCYVGTCEFDSIPADIGVSFTQENFPGLVHLIILYNFHSTFPVNFITT